MKNTIKRIAAGFLTLAFVAGATPANVGSFLKQSTTIVASAEVKSFTDTLSAEATGISISDTKNEWKDIHFDNGSKAVYAGKSVTATSGAIKLNNNTEKYGIVTTTSGGKASTVNVVWNKDTRSGRKLNIYGKKTAYTDATELYNTSKQGTLIGQIEYDKSTELKIDGDYTYIGFRSNNNVLYLDSISITWKKTDISQATVNLAADNTVSSITVDDEAITNLSDFDITYGIDENHTSTTVPTEPGTYYAYVTPKSTNTNYAGTARSAEFVIEPQKPNIANATLTFDKMRVKYTGNELSATFTVKDGEKTLVEGTDFTVSGDIRATEVNNVEGYTVTITGINDYTGELTDKWYIDPLNTFNVSTVNGTVKTTMPVGGFKENQSVTVVGDGNITGYGWYEDNRLVSTKQTYQFYVSHDTNLIWKTLEETDAEKAILGTASINIGEARDSGSRVSYAIQASWDIPSNATNIIAKTYRYYTNDSVDATYVIEHGIPKELSINKAKGAVTYNINVNKTGNNANKGLYIITVVTYTDSNNNVKTVKSNLTNNIVKN